MKETVIQNLAKFPWFKPHKILFTCKACNNVHVWFNNVAWVLINHKWRYRNSLPYWNSWQLPIITRLGDSSLVLLDGDEKWRRELKTSAHAWREPLDVAVGAFRSFDQGKLSAILLCFHGCIFSFKTAM